LNLCLRLVAFAHVILSKNCYFLGVSVGVAAFFLTRRTRRILMIPSRPSVSLPKTYLGGSFFFPFFYCSFKLLSCLHVWLRPPSIVSLVRWFTLVILIEIIFARSPDFFTVSSSIPPAQLAAVLPCASRRFFSRYFILLLLADRKFILLSFVGRLRWPVLPSHPCKKPSIIFSPQDI